MLTLSLVSLVLIVGTTITWIRLRQLLAQTGSTGTLMREVANRSSTLLDNLLIVLLGLSALAISLFTAKLWSILWTGHAHQDIFTYSSSMLLIVVSACHTYIKIYKPSLIPLSIAGFGAAMLMILWGFLWNYIIPLLNALI